MDKHRKTLGCTHGRTDKQWGMLILTNEKVEGSGTVVFINRTGKCVSASMCTQRLAAGKDSAVWILKCYALISAYFTKIRLIFAYKSYDKYTTPLAFGMTAAYRTCLFAWFTTQTDSSSMLAVIPNASGVVYLLYDL